jgi:hypothetical protein
MWLNEGFKGLFKGNWANCLRIGPFQAIEFYCYESYKNLFSTISENKF